MQPAGEATEISSRYKPLMTTSAWAYLTQVDISRVRREGADDSVMHLFNKRTDRVIKRTSVDNSLCIEGQMTKHTSWCVLLNLAHL